MALPRPEGDVLQRDAANAVERREDAAGRWILESGSSAKAFPTGRAPPRAGGQAGSAPNYEIGPTAATLVFGKQLRGEAPRGAPVALDRTIASAPDNARG